MKNKFQLVNMVNSTIFFSIFCNLLISKFVVAVVVCLTGTDQAAECGIQVNILWLFDILVKLLLFTTLQEMF